ncbi:MAG TPA: ABC transporter substrate-binding protein [Beijerinckiaceae bacterium]|jgi:iron complex transport system substrate-binding protein
MPLALSRRDLLLAGTVSLLSFPARADASRRVVSLGGAVTETLYRLGREPEIVGVDSTSQFPPDALKTKPNLGYVRALGAEGLLSLKPDLVLAIEGAGPPDVLNLVAQAGVPIVRVPEDPSAQGVLARIDAVARAVGAEAAGEALASDVRSRFAILDRARAGAGPGLRVLAVLSLQNGRPLVGGRGTTADGMLRLAGAVNAAENLEGWKPLSDEGVIAARPDVVLRVVRGDGRGEDVLALPAFAATPAGRARALVAMDGLYLLGFGPRTPDAALDLVAALSAAGRRG